MIHSYTGYDGSPAVEVITGGLVRFMDLAVPQRFVRQYDWVVSLNVGEYVPKRLEQVYVANVVKAARDGVVVSWGYNMAKDMAGRNEKHQKDVIPMFKRHGFELQFDLSTEVRMDSKFAWNRAAVLVFKRKDSSQESY